jgi:hypothetical protein
MLMHPELVTQRVNPRSITTFFNSISSIEKFEESLPLIQMIGEGSVGNDFSSMFTMFINNKLDKIISPKDILEKDEQYVLNTLTSIMGKDDDYRADIASVIVTRLVNYSLVYASKNSVKPEMLDRITMLVTKDKVFTNDLNYVIVKELLNGNKLKFSKLMLNNKVMEMTTK